MRDDEAMYRKKQWMLLFTCPLSASSTKRTPGSVVYRWPPSGTGALAAAASRLPQSVVRVCGATEDTCMSQRTHTYLAMLVPAARPGRKRERKIELERWQDTITGQYPGKFARGLFHSDGWRGVKRVRRRLAGGDRWYEHPRYQFGTESGDILRLCGETLDRHGVAWRYSRRNTISVARREAVARLEEFVGPNN